jgi:CDP-diacylglycerol--glycerol-3-phosphate 3-phosphatidyltransferase
MTETAAITTSRPKVRLLGVIPEKWVSGFINALALLAGLLVRLNVSPNFITFLALLAGLAAGILFAFNHPGWAVVLFFFCGALDVVDGKVAVKAKKQTLYGAIFDSTLDRYSEFFVYLGLSYHFRGGWALWLPFFAFLGSAMVSYTRARAEGLGIDCRMGLMQRAERITLISTGALAGGIFRVFDIAMIVALAAIALVSNFTAFQRVHHVSRIETQMKKS